MKTLLLIATAALGLTVAASDPAVANAQSRGSGGFCLVLLPGKHTTGGQPFLASIPCSRLEPNELRCPINRDRMIDDEVREACPWLFEDEAA